MNGIQQSGIITPNHAVAWAAPGVVQDGGAFVNGKLVLGVLKGANFNTTNDQPITIRQTTLAFQLTQIVVTNASINMTTAVGGFYPQPAKAGTALVANSQVYSGLSTPIDSLINVSLSSFAQTNRLSTRNLGTIGPYMNIWFSLTTPQGATASADIFILGFDLT